MEHPDNKTNSPLCPPLLQPRCRQDLHYSVLVTTKTSIAQTSLLPIPPLLHPCCRRAILYSILIVAKSFFNPCSLSPSPPLLRPRCICSKSPSLPVHTNCKGERRRLEYRKRVINEKKTHSTILLLPHLPTILPRHRIHLLDVHIKPWHSTMVQPCHTMVVSRNEW